MAKMLSMKHYLFIVLMIFLFSCNNDKREKIIRNDTLINGTKNTDSNTAFPIKRVDGFNQNRNLFFSVYELSKKTTALIVSLSDRKEENTIFDTIFEKLAKTDSLIYTTVKNPINCSYYDTSGQYPLLKSIKLENEIRKHIDSEYYVYGTKGYEKVKIKDIVFGLHECGSSIIAFCIDKIDISKIGHPIIASSHFYNLSYGGDYSKLLEKTKLNKKIENPDGEFTDKIETKVFANAGNLYFTYNDDFQWGRNPALGNCLYPARNVFIQNKDGSFSQYWSEDLDLFGIECL